MAENPERSIATANAYAAGNIANLDDAWTKRLVASVVDTESSGGNLRADNGVGYYGRYQGGAGWLVDAGLVNREKYDAALKASGVDSDWDWGKQGGSQRFLNDPSNWNNGQSLDRYLGSAELQDQAFRTNSNATYNQAVRNGVLSADSEPNVVAGFLKARHLGGYDNAVDAAQGRGNVQDANGTSTGKYYNDIARNNDGFDRNFVPNFVRKETEITVNPLSDGVLKRGESGDAVKELQQKLTAAGFSTQGSDGVYGQNTQDAVKAFQQARNLNADGIAGPKTLEALGIQVNTTQPQPQPQPQPNRPETNTNPNTTPTQPTPTPVNPANDRNWPAPGNYGVKISNGGSDGHGEFGDPRSNSRGYHTGVDISGKVGDPIESFRPGKVVELVRNDPSAGNFVTIDHGDGLRTRYLHLDTISVEMDQSVTENTKIGTMGRTGNTPSNADTHLHFETRVNGEPVDPRQYLNFPPRETLDKGDRGKDVQALQEALIRNGANIKADGTFGDGTKAAVETFQKAQGLTVDGIAGPATQKALGVTHEQAPAPPATNPTPTNPTQPNTPNTPTSNDAALADNMLRRGEEGPAVKKLQEDLTKAGFSTQGTDGRFGQNTEDAVKRYQEARGLQADGIAGPATLAALSAQQQAPSPAQPTAASAATPTANAQPTVPTTQSTPTDSAQAPANAQPTPTDKPQTPQTATPQTAPSAGNDHGHSHDHPQTAPPPTAATNAPPTATDKPQTPPTGNDHAQPPTQNDKPLISNANHPDNKLYQQAVSNLEQLGPSGGFKSRENLEKAAAAVAVDAKATGLQSVDHVSKTNAPNGQTFLVAVQGDPTSPAAKNSYVDYAQATSQTVAQSTALTEAQKPAAQQADQQEPNRIALGAR